MRPLPRFILYFGSNSSASTSRHRADALRRLGCEVLVVDPQSLIGRRSRLQSLLDYRTGFQFVQKKLLHSLRSSEDLCGLSVDLLWIDSGEFFGSRIVQWLAGYFACPVLLYNVDDPTGPRDSSRFTNLISSLVYYSLCVFVRQETALEALALGAKHVLAVHRSYDEIAHNPHQITPQQTPQPIVSFVGTLIPGEFRDRFLTALAKAGLPVRLIGNSWQRSYFWPFLKTIYHGPGRTGKAYSQALGDAAVSLGFLSHQNRDLVTTRSFETPACGGLFCAERTSEHQLLYEDGHEAILWDTVEECTLHCYMLLADPMLRHLICMSGAEHVRKLGVGNEDICRQILAFL